MANTFTRIVRHEDTVRKYPEQYGEPCVIVRCDWPYECGAKDKYPGHEVFRCVPHYVWWHDAPVQGKVPA